MLHIICSMSTESIGTTSFHFVLIDHRLEFIPYSVFLKYIHITTPTSKTTTKKTNLYSTYFT